MTARDLAPLECLLSNGRNGCLREGRGVVIRRVRPCSQRAVRRVVPRICATCRCRANSPVDAVIRSLPTGGMRPVHSVSAPGRNGCWTGPWGVLRAGVREVVRSNPDREICVLMRDATPKHSRAVCRSGSGHARRVVLQVQQKADHAVGHCVLNNGKRTGA